MQLKQLKKIQKEALKGFAEIESVEQLESLRVEFLGKKGKLSEILKQMGSLEPEERKKIGANANTLKNEIEALIEESKLRLGNLGKNKILEQR